MDIYGNKLVNTIETKPLCASSSDLSKFLCRLRSIAAHRDHFVRHLSVCACVCLSDIYTFLIVTHSYVSQATHAFLGMLPLCFLIFDNFYKPFCPLLKFSFPNFSLSSFEILT